MTLVSCGYLPMPQPHGVSAVGTASTLDAADEMAWALHPIHRPAGGTISHIHYRTGTVTTGATVDVRVETVDASGQPSGTLWNTNTNGSQVIADANDNVLFRTALTAGAVVTLGQVVAVVVKNPSSSFGNFGMNRSPSQLGVRGFPYPGGPLATDKLGATGTPFALEYDDGFIELPPAILPGACTPASFTISTGSNPDEAGLLFTAPFAARVVGWWMFAQIGTGGITYRMALYQSGNNTPLATVTMDSDFRVDGSARMYMGSFESAVTLVAGTSYRVSFVALSGTNCTLHRLTAFNNAWFDTLGLPGAQETSRNRSGTSDPDSASWSETSTQRIQMGLIVDQIDDGAGSGSGGLLLPNKRGNRQ